MARPRLNLPPEKQPAFLQGRVPEAMHEYLRLLAVRKFSNLNKMYEKMFESFAELKPWEMGLVWRKPQAVKSVTDGIAKGTGWIQINIQITTELHEKVKEQAEAIKATHGVTLASYVYTALYWWCVYVYPPVKKAPQPKK